MMPHLQLNVLQGVAANASLESLTAKGYSYSQIAGALSALEEQGLIVSDLRTGLVLTAAGKEKMALRVTRNATATNVFISPAIKHRTKRLDPDMIYVPNRQKSSFFREQGH